MNFFVWSRNGTSDGIFMNGPGFLERMQACRHLTLGLGVAGDWLLFDFFFFFYFGVELDPGLDNTTAAALQWTPAAVFWRERAQSASCDDIIMRRTGAHHAKIRGSGVGTRHDPVWRRVRGFVHFGLGDCV